MFHIEQDLKSLEKSIIAFEQKPIEKGKILFYGHSLFTRWSNPQYGMRPLEEEIKGKDGTAVCINHGFGTSTSEELLYYYPRAVRPWEPRALVVMTFGNDTMYGYSVEQTMTNLVKLLHWARTDFPGIKLYVVEEHPHPSTKAPDSLPDKWVTYLHRKNQYCQMLEMYAQSHPDTKIIKLWDKPEFFETAEDVGNFRKVREDLFVADKVHLNQAGYDVFGPIVREALDEIL